MSPVLGGGLGPAAKVGQEAHHKCLHFGLLVFVFVRIRLIFNYSLLRRPAVHTFICLLRSRPISG